MSSMATDIATLLALSEAALGLVRGDNLFVALEPKTPDACVTVRDTAGLGPIVHAAGDIDEDLRQPTIQVKVRGTMEATGRSTAYALTEAILGFLHKRAEDSVNSSRYLGIFATSEPIDIGEDENNRPQYTINFRAIRATAP